MAVDVGSAVGYLDLDISGFLNGLKTAQTEANKTSQNMATQVGNKISGMGKSLTSAGSTLTKSLTLPITGAGAAIIKVSSDFEAGMSKVSAISGATGEDLDKLRAKAQEMGAKTKFSATESAEAFQYMAMAGWKTEDMLQGIDGIMALAAADGLDLATTSDIVTDALTAFGMSASESGHFADVLAKASSSANTNVSMLGESFKYVAPVAGSLGFTAEDTAIALGLMANAGIKGSQGGTALRGALTKLIKPTDDAAALMEKYNLQLTNSDGSMKSLGEVMKMLRDNLGDLTEAEQANVAANIFGQEAMSGMLAIINASDSDFENLTNQIYNADGAAQQMADTMQDNLSGQITILKSTLEGLALQFGEIILPYVKKFVEKIQELVQKFQALSPQQKEQIVKWAAILAAIGPVLMIVGKLTSGIGDMITTFGKIPGAITKVKGGFNTLHTGFLNMKEGFALSKAGFSGLATEAGGFGTKIGAAAAGVTAPMIAIAAVVAVVIAAFVSLWKNNEDFRNKITAIWNQIKGTFENFTKGIVDRLNSLGFNFKDITEVISAIWKGFCDLLAPYFEGVFQYIADTFKFITNTILNTIDFFIALFKGDWEGCWKAVKAQFENIWNSIKDWFKNILNTIKGMFDVVLGWFGTSWSKCWNDIKNFFVNIWNGIKSFFEGILNGIKSFFVNTWDGIKTAATNVLNSIKSIFTNTWDGIKNSMSNVIDSIKSIFTGGFEGIKSTVTGVFDAIKSKISSVMDGAKSIVTSAISSLKSAFNFSWSLPELKVPKITVSGGKAPYGIGGKGSLPSFKVEWHAKAMRRGMILNDATIFGMDDDGNLLGGGEAGSETVVGTKSLMQMIRQAVNESIKPFLIIGSEITRTSSELGYIMYDGFSKQSKAIEKLVSSDKKDEGNGDTFIFNSPKPIDEIEAAKQLKKTKRELAEGF